MYEAESREHYIEAKVRGKKSYQARKAKGESGHVPSLDGLLKEVEIISTVELGTKDILLKRIVGTYTKNRRNSFARNFMPLEAESSEFAQKWMAVCAHQLQDGISDPIKVYEYMNYYYVMEGNKRVSVLKYFDSVSIMGNVFRLIPKYDESDEDIVKYYAFLELNKLTGIDSIWMSKARRFYRLLDYLANFEAPEGADNKYKYFFEEVYQPFRKVFKEFGGDKLDITTGDAYILYAKLYGINAEMDLEHLKGIMPSLLKELGQLDNFDSFDIIMKTEPLEREKSFLESINIFKSHKKLKVGFVYARDVEKSGWTYSHDLGRIYVEEKYDGDIETSYIDNVPEDESAYDVIKEFSQQGFDIIFTTSEVFRRATLKCALEYPNISYFNCSENRPYVHLTNYFGRTYEPRFLSGLIAGSMTKTDIIGYTASRPSNETISSINAFALGARMVNPNVKIYVAWTGEWNNPEKSTQISNCLIEKGADIVSNKNLIVPRDVTWRYGVYSMVCTIDPETKMPKEYLASPIWNWGVFYEKIIGSIINGAFRKINTLYDDDKLINFWWGMASEALDIYYSKKHVPAPTQKLVELMKQMIISDTFHPFTGPISDSQGSIRVPENQILGEDDILMMDWFVDSVVVLEPENKLFDSEEGC